MNVRKWKLLLPAVAFLCGSQAAAQSVFEVTPFGAYRFGGSFNLDGTSGSYDAEDSPSAGLILNWRHGENTQWEIIYARQDTDANFDGATINDPSLGVLSQLLQLGGTVEGSGNRFRPYLAATLGGTRIEVTSRGSESDTFVSGSIGVGLLFRPESRIGIRLEARGHGTLVSSDTDLLCRTGPDLNACALRVEGDVLWQFETFAGIVIRF